MTILYILLAILLLGILITVHEFGHFMAARMTGIDVVEFAIGFGPKLFGWKSKKYETVFSLRAIPMGGYCMFYGEDDAEGKHIDDPRAYNRQNVWKRMFTVLMGPAMNFALAFVVAVFYIFSTGIYGIIPYIMEVEAQGPAAVAGMLNDDVITQVNGVSVLDGTTQTLLDELAVSSDEPIILTVSREAGEETLNVLPFFDQAANKYRIGVTIGARYTDTTEPVTFIEAVKYSGASCWNAGGLILNALKNLVTTGEGLDQTAGPVGVVKLISEETRTGGLGAYINLLVSISINLGLMNLLPIPGLDGSRFLFMLLEAIRRKPIAPKKEAVVHLTGMLLLFGVMIFFTFKDVINIFK